jgi:hypothetical protein
VIALAAGGLYAALAKTALAADAVSAGGAPQSATVLRFALAAGGL